MTFRISGFGFRVSSFGFRVSGFGFEVSGFWFLISGLRVYHFEVLDARDNQGPHRLPPLKVLTTTEEVALTASAIAGAP